MSVQELPILGKTIEAIQGGKNDDQLIFNLVDGTRYCMSHIQDCCESVEIIDIAGDLKNLIGNPLLQAEVVSSENYEDILDIPEQISFKLRKKQIDVARDESETWTFYKFATIKGSVTVRWYGTSNGYYSEEVYFRQIK